MRLIRYNDLVARGVVKSRMTLKRLIDFQDFPPGALITPNARAWNEDEVDAWIAARPAARKPSTRKPISHSSTQDAATTGSTAPSVKASRRLSTSSSMKRGGGATTL